MQIFEFIELEFYILVQTNHYHLIIEIAKDIYTKRRKEKGWNKSTLEFSIAFFKTLEFYIEPKNRTLEN